ncbi:DUF6647 family protein [Sagittula sp. SSi028]|uniref:DUF6647 family protein n=1 Tax=Sagittula sp. SSi028 TaxID=3400636 RepID=UPI003AF5AC11
MEALIDLMLDLVAEHTDYDTTRLDPPVVVEVGRGFMTDRFYDGRAHMMPATGVEERLNALYVEGRNDSADIIFIVPADQFAGASYFENPQDNPLWREVLLHEMVHHAQKHAGGDTWTCVGRGEAEAYQVGAAYLADLGLPDPMKDRTIWKTLYTDC